MSFEKALDCLQFGKGKNLDSILASCDEINSLAFRLRYCFGPELFELFMKYGLDVNWTNNEGISHLERAIVVKNDRVARLLIEKGAGINRVGGTGKTPLILSLEARLYSLTDFIIKLGADIDLKDKWGNKAVFYALEGNQTETAKLLVGSDANVKNGAGVPLLYVSALIKKNYRFTKFLIERGATFDEMKLDLKSSNTIYLP